MSEQIPMMEWAEAETISSILRDRLGGTAIALEFGCGGSTVAFSPLAKKWTAIEHDPEWKEKARNWTGEDPDVHIEFVPPDQPHAGLDAAEPGQFASYVEASRGSVRMVGMTSSWWMVAPGSIACCS